MLLHRFNIKSMIMLSLLYMNEMVTFYWLLFVAFAYDMIEL